MREGWVEVGLGELFEVSNEVLGPHDVEPEVFSVTKHHGIVPADEYHDQRIASRNLVKYKLLKAGDFAYSTIHIDEGSIGRNNLGRTGVISPMYTVLTHRHGSSALPEYLELCLKTPDMLLTYYQHAAGSVNRRRSLTYARFSQITVSLPRLEEQRRIVDLISSVDTAIEAAERARAEKSESILALLGDIFEPWPSEGEVLGQLAAMSSGPSWAAADEFTDSIGGGIPVLKITNTKSDGSLDLDEIAHVARLPGSTRTLSPGDVILIRTNGNRERIGNVYRADASISGFAYSAFQIGLFPHDSDSGDYLYWALSAPWVQSAITDAASGSTGLGNIALSWLRKLPIAMPDQSARSRITDIFNSLQATVETLSSQAEALRVLRSSILSDLTSGNYEIPDSYDRLLEAAS